MLLYLLRHAEAEVLAASDRARRLTPKGEDQAQRVGKFCRDQGFGPSVVLSSPVTRAWQTAKLVHKSLPDAGLIEVPWAACGMDPFDALEQMKVFAVSPSVMLVGHQPDLGVLAALLLGLPEPRALRVRKALIMGIDVSQGLAPRRGVLQFFLPVKML